MRKLFSILFLFAAAAIAPAGDRAAELGFRQSVLQSPQDGELLYCQAVEGKELPGKYALVLFLHGAEARGSDNQAQLECGVVPMLNYIRKNRIKAVVLVPQCPAHRAWINPETGAPSEETRLLLRLIEMKEKELEIDPARIYAVGTAMGGFGVWSLAAMRPEKFAAAIPICGGGNPADAPKLIGVPMQVFHGSADRTVPERFSREMVEAVRKAGGSRITYREFDGAGHDESRSDACRDSWTWEWLFGQVKQP